MVPISVIRIAGLILGLYVLVSAFLMFRRRRISRTETSLRWLFGGGMIVVGLFPESVNFLRSLLALETHTFGRLFALLIVSNLLVWFVLFRERGKLFDSRGDFDRLVRSLTVKSALTNDLDNMPKPVDILVVLPAYNEGDSIGAVLARIPESIRGHAVGAVVIDDGSRDNTREETIRAGFPVVSSPIQRGQGAALRLGYDLARKVDARIVVTLDADGQHLPEEIEDVVLPILDDTKDFVIGSRLLGHREKDSRFRLIGIHLNNALIRFLAGAKISDCSSGFKAIRVSSLEKIVLREDQFQAAEALISAAHNKLRLGEVPITVKRRLSGESKKGRNWSYGLNFLRTVLNTWWR